MSILNTHRATDQLKVQLLCNRAKDITNNIINCNSFNKNKNVGIYLQKINYKQYNNIIYNY